VLAAAVLAVAAAPGAVQVLELQGSAGEPWRLLTGHLVHGTTYHLLWNLAALVTLGFLFEDVLRRGLWSLALASGLTVGLGVIALDPELAAYRGLSGLLNGLWVGGALVAARLERGRGNRGLARLYLACVLADLLKIAVEAGSGGALFTDEARLGGTPVPLAHALGALGAMLWLGARRAKLGAGNPVEPACVDPHDGVGSSDESAASQQVQQAQRGPRSRPYRAGRSAQRPAAKQLPPGAEGPLQVLPG
jgi:rhomboid family GlyGly-CTERM serine protease